MINKKGVINLSEMPQILTETGVIFLILFLWLVSLTLAFYKFAANINNLTKGVESGKLVDIFKQILQEAAKNTKQLEKLEKNLNSIYEDSKGHLQKVSLLRFNPFSDTGGDQSFVATFLDGENSGIIISSLHSRAGTRIYAKPVEKGKPKGGARLSTDEEKGLKAAIAAKE